MLEPEKMTLGGSEAQMNDSKPGMEETEAEADAKAPMDTETEAAEVKDQDQVEEPIKLEEDGKLQAQLVGDNPYTVEQQAVADQTHGNEDTSKTLNVVDADGQNEEILKFEENDVAEFKDVEDKSLAEIVTKIEVVEHDDTPIHSHDNGLCGSPNSDIKPQDDDNWERIKDLSTEREIKMQVAMTELGDKNTNLCFDNAGSDTEEDQAAFIKEVEAFYKEKNLEFKHPKFYKEDLNLLKLWKAVIKLGGYKQVTSCKLWRQVGESFNPPKTCTTVSWTFRIFYEKALLEYEKHKIHGGTLPHSDASFIEPNVVESQAGSNQTPGSGRAKRDAAARAMQSWHSQRVLDNGEDKSSIPTPKSDRQLKNYGLLKRKKPSTLEHGVQVSAFKETKPQLDTMVINIGAPADWVKINVQKTVSLSHLLFLEQCAISLLSMNLSLSFSQIDCYEVYALVPGLLREEVHVQSDPAGRLVISGQPKQLDNPWGVTPFKKVVNLPSRIDPSQTSAVVTLHGQLFVRVPFELPDV
ncbi:AT-rich interactive domain-containing protein 6-like isoform X2 [Durio zibethinus]|uniref:AT-rich interactive domain-containing protein 6-like isoform X2 n=1 Tax=Durio zibethinus TaxID=66656 RepID=A0A6P5YTT7_DURZI|nr:AT-rich interactive domain-containing protein 6-like isoform X2 [Durio zibethinus]